MTYITLTENGQQEYYTVDEAARILRVTAETVRRLCKSGQMPARKIGRRWLIPSSYVNRNHGVTNEE